MYVNYNGSYRNQGHGPKIWLNEPQCIKMCYPHNESWFDPLILALHPLYLHMQCMNQHRLLTLRYCSSFVHVGRLLKKSSSGSKSNCFSSSVCKHSRTTSVRHIHRPIRDIMFANWTLCIRIELILCKHLGLFASIADHPWTLLTCP